MNFSQTSIQKTKIDIENFLQEIGIIQVREEIFNGLNTENKYISSKFFYDKTGSELFEQITHLPEYYPSRTEMAILKALNLDFIRNFDNLHLIEIGSGDHTKAAQLIRKIPVSKRNTTTYVPLDISASAINNAGDNLLKLYPQIKIKGIVADFMHQIHSVPNSENRLFCFLGSTIGNFTQTQIADFMQNMSALLKQDEYLLLGFDTIKNTAILENAYNDSKDVTGKFNLNILNVVNSLAKTNFKPSDFKHIAFYNEKKNRIEMHLEARKPVTVYSPYNGLLQIKQGERIHTENSHKFSKYMIEKIAHKANFQVAKIFTDDNNWFNIALLKKQQS